MLGALKRVLSFKYNDHPMRESVYEFHALWLKYFHDYFFRCEHLGSLSPSLKTAQREHVIFISNHALTFEGALLNYYLYIHRAGMVHTLVFPEAFKVPFVREFFRSTQCLPISVENGARALARHHVLLFPEGMDFMRGLGDPDHAPRFHTGFLHMAKAFLRSNGRKTVHIVPIAHAGVERSFKFWVVKNQVFMDWLIRPFFKYPFWVIPKLPFLIPSKVVFNWGEPIRLKLSDLRTQKNIMGWSERFRSTIHDLRQEAILQRDRHKWSVAHTV